MAKLTAGTRLVVASHNPGKVWEIGQLLAPYGLDAISAADLNLPEPEETATTFAGNAQLKAVAAAEGSGLPALADDPGLEVECLDGAPGIYSARWAGPGKDFGLAMQKLADEIAVRKGWETPPRANFISVLCLAWPSGETRVFAGRVFGHLVWPARGGNGFGYDPMFVADGASETFGEMEPAAKYAISHRTRAFALFKSEMLDQIAPGENAARGSQRDKDAFFAAAASLSTRPELAAFVDRLRGDLEAHGGEWATIKLDDFLAALAGELAAGAQTDEPAWRQIAHALLAASAKP